MIFKAGDAVIVIEVPGVRYPIDCQPGTTGVIVKACSCEMWRLYGNGRLFWSFMTATREVCAVEIALRKIDPDGRQVIQWDWRTLLLEREHS